MWKERFGSPLSAGRADGAPGLFVWSLRAAALVFIRGYQLLISPVLPGNCRFTPTCSSYAAEAFRRHTPHKALWLTLRRVARCHPLHPGGSDPVP